MMHGRKKHQITLCHLHHVAEQFSDLYLVLHIHCMYKASLLELETRDHIPVR